MEAWFLKTPENRTVYSLCAAESSTGDGGCNCNILGLLLQRLRQWVSGKMRAQFIAPGAGQEDIDLW